MLFLTRSAREIPDVDVVLVTAEEVVEFVEFVEFVGFVKFASVVEDELAALARATSASRSSR